MQRRVLIYTDEVDEWFDNLYSDFKPKFASRTKWLYRIETDSLYFEIVSIYNKHCRGKKFDVAFVTKEMNDETKHMIYMTSEKVLYSQSVKDPANIRFVAPRGNQKSTAAIRTLFGLVPIELTEVNVEDGKHEFYR